tara:strand:+ start:22571 stop:23083 length:513 start_codon:yes stop_codon:yes gene_type:complete
MSWKVDLVVMLRSLIGDLDSATFTDERLKQILVVGAFNVINDADFSNDYTVSVSSVSISPDPISEQDTDFSILTTYKAACILVGSQVKTEASNAIAIKDGPSSIDLRGVTQNLNTLYKDLCQKYTDLLDTYRYNKGSGDGTPAGAAILSPYSPASWGVGNTRYDQNRYFQ